MRRARPSRRSAASTTRTLDTPPPATRPPARRPPQPPRARAPRPRARGKRSPAPRGAAAGAPSCAHRAPGARASEHARSMAPLLAPLCARMRSEGAVDASYLENRNKRARSIAPRVCTATACASAASYDGGGGGGGGDGADALDEKSSLAAAAAYGCSGGGPCSTTAAPGGLTSVKSFLWRRLHFASSELRASRYSAGSPLLRARARGLGATMSPGAAFEIGGRKQTRVQRVAGRVRPARRRASARARSSAPPPLPPARHPLLAGACLRSRALVSGVVVPGRGCGGRAAASAAALPAAQRVAGCRRRERMEKNDVAPRGGMMRAYTAACATARWLGESILSRRACPRPSLRPSARLRLRWSRPRAARHRLRGGARCGRAAPRARPA